MVLFSFDASSIDCNEVRYRDWIGRFHN